MTTPDRAIKLIENLCQAEMAICRKGYATQTASEKERKAIKALFSALTGNKPTDAEMAILWDNCR